MFKKTHNSPVEAGRKIWRQNGTVLSAKEFDRAKEGNGTRTPESQVDWHFEEGNDENGKEK